MRGLNENGSYGKGCEDVNWIHMVQDRDQWQALVNMVMNFWFHIRGALS
jgi:hypothetical protein